MRKSEDNGGECSTSLVTCCGNYCSRGFVECCFYMYVLTKTRACSLARLLARGLLVARVTECAAMIAREVVVVNALPSARLVVLWCFLLRVLLGRDGTSKSRQRKQDRLSIRFLFSK